MHESEGRYCSAGWLLEDHQRVADVSAEASGSSLKTAFRPCRKYTRARSSSFSSSGSSSFNALCGQRFRREMKTKKKTKMAEVLHSLSRSPLDRADTTSESRVCNGNWLLDGNHLQVFRPNRAEITQPGPPGRKPSRHGCGPKGCDIFSSPRGNLVRDGLKLSQPCRPQSCASGFLARWANAI